MELDPNGEYVIMVDRRPSLPHVHACLGPMCAGRAWECTRTGCIQSAYVGGCEQGEPQAPAPRSPTPCVLEPGGEVSPYA